MKDIRKRPYRMAPDLIPVELGSLNISCTACNRPLGVPWLEKLEYPKQPIDSLVVPGYFVWISIPMVCSYKDCGISFEEKVPILPNKSRWGMYGDEAGRYIDSPSKKYFHAPINFYCLTLVAAHTKIQSKLQSKINKLKAIAKPNIDPNSWSLHFTKIWSSSTESDEFSFKDKNSKIEFAKSFAKIIEQSLPELVFFNYSSCITIPCESERATLLKKQKEKIFSLSIISTLIAARKNGISLNWTY